MAVRQPPLVRPAPLQNKKFYIQQRILSLGEPRLYGSRKRQKLDARGSYGNRMGGRQFVGTRNEGAIISNQCSTTDLSNRKPTTADMDDYTNHYTFQDLPVVDDSASEPRIRTCRFCQERYHDIKSCCTFHTNGEGIVQDDDPTRKFGYSVVYHFPNKPAIEYEGNREMLKHPPRRELCSRTEYSTRRKAKDYLLDRKVDPVEIVLEGQSQHFPTISDKELTTNSTTTGKRKRDKQVKLSLEQRVIYLERLYKPHVADCYSNKITNQVVTIKEVSAEIFRLAPFQKVVDLHKTEKDGLCHFLRRIRITKRNDGTFTPAEDLIPDQKKQMPNNRDNKKNENDDAYSTVDKVYHREVIGENSNETHSVVHHAMHATSKGQSRVAMDMEILEIVLKKVRTMSKSPQQIGRETITSRVNFGRNEPVSSPIGGNHSQNFSQIGSSDQHGALNMCESQQSPPTPTDLEAEAALGSLSIDLDVVVSQTNDNQDMSASQIIVRGVDAFQVDDKTPIKKTHSVVKEVSRNYLYGYRYFVQCI